jgi:hypothetical protein
VRKKVWTKSVNKGVGCVARGVGKRNVRTGWQKKKKKSATGRIEKSKKILAQNEKAFKNMPFHCAWEFFRKKHMDWSGYKR